MLDRCEHLGQAIQDGLNAFQAPDILPLLGRIGAVLPRCVDPTALRAAACHPCIAAGERRQPMTAVRRWKGRKGETLGAVLRTKDRTKPIFVSVGHKMGLSQALDILLHCYRHYRIPEPTRLADQYVGTMRQAHGRGG